MSQTANPLHFEGYASVFHKPDGHGHIIKPGAYTRSIARFRADPLSIKLLWQHNQHHPIGHITSLEEDEYGLKMRGHISPITRQSQDALQLVAHKCVHQLSVGFRPMRKQRIASHLHILEADLYEISLVSIPANPWAVVYFTSNQPITKGNI